MTERAFAHPWVLWLLVLLPALGLLRWFALRRKRHALARIGSSLALRPLIDESPWMRWFRRVFFSTSLSFLVLGAAGPQWGRDWDQTVSPGRDLVVVLDLSRSMLAEAPSRLERAVAGVEGLVEAMRERGGHRIALVVFAGRPRVLCPLTQDYDHVRHSLGQIVSPSPTADLGHGTRIGEALRLAVAIHVARQSVDPNARGHQDILLISDGDDPEEDDEWRGGLLEAAAERIPVYAVAVGDPERDSPINLAGGPQKHGDDVVLTRAREKPLQDIARGSDGVYVAAPVGTPDLGDLFRQRIETRVVGEGADDALPVYKPRYAWFLGPALALLIVSMVLPESLSWLRSGRNER